MLSLTGAVSLTYLHMCVRCR